MYASMCAKRLAPRGQATRALVAEMLVRRMLKVLRYYIAFALSMLRSVGWCALVRTILMIFKLIIQTPTEN